MHEQPTSLTQLLVHCGYQRASRESRCQREALNSSKETLWRDAATLDRCCRVLGLRSKCQCLSVMTRSVKASSLLANMASQHVPCCQFEMLQAQLASMGFSSTVTAATDSFASFSNDALLTACHARAYVVREDGHGWCVDRRVAYARVLRVCC